MIFFVKWPCWCQMSQSAAVGKKIQHRTLFSAKENQLTAYQVITSDIFCENICENNQARPRKLPQSRSGPNIKVLRVLRVL